MLKGKKSIIIIIVLVIMLLLVLILHKKNFSTKDNNILNTYQGIVSISDKNKNIKEYLGYYNDYYYYIDGYSLSDVYVVQADDESDITKEVLLEAKKSIKENKNTFIYKEKKYYTENIFDALYMQNNSIALFIEDVEYLFNDIIKEKNDQIFKLKEIKKNNSKDFKKSFNSSYGGSIYLKNIDIIFENDNKITKINNLSNLKIGSEQIIEELVKEKKKLFEDDPLSEEIIATIAYEYDSNDYLVIEKRRNLNKVEYYIYLEEQTSFKNRLGF